MRMRAVMAGAVAMILSLPLAASGPLGIFALIDKVVFEPDESRAERVQLWGVFGYTNGVGALTAIERGYMYFRLPSAGEVNDLTLSTTLIRREWADLKSVAGTDQPVGFSVFGVGGNRVLERTPGGSAQSKSAVFAPNVADAAALRVRPSSEKPEAPAVYRIDTGVTRLSATGNRADLVKTLQEAGRRK